MNAKDKKIIMFGMPVAILILLVVLGKNIPVLLRHLNPKSDTEEKTEALSEKTEAGAPALTPIPDSPVKPPSSTTPQVASVSPKTPVPSQKRDYFLQKQEQNNEAGWGQDPFHPRAKKVDIEEVQETVVEEPPPDFKLTGISKIGSNYIATINRNLVNVDSLISGFKVTAISDDRVTLVKNEKIYELHLSH